MLVMRTTSGASRRRGAAAVEMALVAPLLVLLFFGIVEFGSIFYVRNMMVHAAREGARELATQGATLEEAIARTEAYLASANIDGATVTGENAYKGSGDDAAARQVFINVELPVNAALLSQDLLGVFNSAPNMEARVYMRKEGELLPAPEE